MKNMLSYQNGTTFTGKDMILSLPDNYVEKYFKKI